MGIDAIGALLGRFKHIRPPDETVRTLAVEIINNRFGVELDKKKIRLRNGEMYVECGPHLRNMLFMHKEEILEEIEKSLGDKTPRGIR